MNTDNTKIASHLPMLRRFSRLLLGNQQSGDLLVHGALRELALTQRSLEYGDVKTMLFQTVIGLWLESLNTTWSSPVSQSDRMRSISRAMFLLRQLEEFPRHAVQSILQLDEKTYDDAVVMANEEVNQLLASDVMIIEDELLIAFQLESLMTTLGHSVTTVVRTAKQAVKAAKLNPPRLILSDVQLADMSSGLDAVREITRDHPIPAIFITAFPERLLTGMGSEPTYMVTKPFRVEQIKAVVSQVLFFDAKVRTSLTKQQLCEVLAKEWAPIE
jgi:CheY-like chemotaxis protein